jgi:hypothetical protein
LKNNGSLGNKIRENKSLAYPLKLKIIYLKLVLLIFVLVLMYSKSCFISMLILFDIFDHSHISFEEQFSIILLQKNIIALECAIFLRNISITADGIIFDHLTFAVLFIYYNYSKKYY